MKDSSQYIQLNNEQDLASALKEHPKVVVLFYASWCPYCSRFLPIFKKHAEGREQNFLLVQDDQETICDKYSVAVFPTVLYFEYGKPAKRLDGVRGAGLNEKQLVEFDEDINCRAG